MKFQQPGLLTQYLVNHYSYLNFEKKLKIKRLKSIRYSTKLLRNVHSEAKRKKIMKSRQPQLLTQYHDKHYSHLISKKKF